MQNGDFGLADDERSRQPKNIEDKQLKALLGVDCCQRQEELAKSLEVTETAISNPFKAVG